jgi:hypothetical protein
MMNHKCGRSFNWNWKTFNATGLITTSLTLDLHLKCTFLLTYTYVCSKGYNSPNRAYFICSYIGMRYWLRLS